MAAKDTSAIRTILLPLPRRRSRHVVLPVTTVDKTYPCTYDGRRNITSVSGDNDTMCGYDGLDRLVRENNQAAGRTWTYTYVDVHL